MGRGGWRGAGADKSQPISTGGGGGSWCAGFRPGSDQGKQWRRGVSKKRRSKEKKERGGCTLGFGRWPSLSVEQRRCYSPSSLSSTIVLRNEESFPGRSVLGSRRRLRRCRRCRCRRSVLLAHCSCSLLGASSGTGL